MTALSAHPGYVFRGKTYKRLSVFLYALAKDSGANEIGAVTSDNTISAFSRTADARHLVKKYCITPPAAGEKQFVSNCFLPGELDRARRNALVASAYNAVVAMREPGTEHGLPGGLHMSSVGLPDEPRQFVMKPAAAHELPDNLRSALLCAYSSKLLAEQQAGQQMLYTFADCNAALKFVNC